MANYTVQAGDCLSSIAAAHGFADYRTVYDHPANAAFKKKRPNPNLIFPDDVVFIPDKRDKALSGSTDRLHRFRKQVAKTRFRVRIQYGFDFDYHLDIEGATFEGSLEDGGVIDVPIPPDARKGQLTIRLNDRQDREPMQFDLALGHLDPIDETKGVQARLVNLGFDCGAIDGDAGPQTERALRAFQRSVGLAPTGQVDDDTRNALALRHDIS